MAGLAPWQARLGRALRAARKRADKSQTDVARFMRDRLQTGRTSGDVGRVGTQTVYRIERGDGVNTNQIAAYLEAIGADLQVIEDDTLGVRVTPQTQPLQSDERPADFPARQLTLEARKLLKGLPDLDDFVSLIHVWKRLGSTSARIRFIDAAFDYARAVAAGLEPTGTLGKKD